MHVCMYVWMNVCVYVCMKVCMCACMYVRINNAKKEARILWTCYAIRWIGKRSVAGIQRWNEEERMSKEKWRDEIHEVIGMKLAELRDVTTERKHWRRLVKTVARTQRVDSTR